MTVFLDANIVIYFIEQHPVWGAKAARRIASVRSGGGDLAVSDLVRMECQVGPLISGDRALIADYAKFFARPEVKVLSVTAVVCDRAAAIRAKYRYKPLDSLHLAAAADAKCDTFLTNDTRLHAFADVNVEVLA